MMATRDEMRRLLSVACPHCGAAPHGRCRVRVRVRRGKQALDLPIKSLDGGCHDARWLVALGRQAPVRADVVAARRGARDTRTRRGSVAVLDPPTQEAPDERPW